MLNSQFLNKTLFQQLSHLQYKEEEDNKESEDLVIALH